jgi:hypothetical protein
MKSNHSDYDLYRTLILIMVSLLKGESWRTLGLKFCSFLPTIPYNFRLHFCYPWTLVNIIVLSSYS